MTGAGRSRDPIDPFTLSRAGHKSSGEFLAQDGGR